MNEHKNEWWKKAVVYEIYPKSFKDTKGNGIGDLNGITEKLDYLKELGIDVIWLTPIYESPQKDNGYDISDYYNINKDYGTMSDFKILINESHKRDIKVIMDMVVNHTSTEHEWFKNACKSKTNEYKDFYIWRASKDGICPNNWESKFGGSAWQYNDKTGEYYLHLFDITQADLRWESDKLRKKIYEMMNFWLKKNVDGFRLDVINLISKDQNFPNDIDGNGKKFYTDGPKVHEFIHEMNKEVFSKYDIMTVGEMSSTNIKHCIEYTNPNREELNMVFNFHHLKVDYENREKWTKKRFDFIMLKKILSEWQIEMFKGGGWNALFWCNHDQPRIVSRYGDDKKYRKESAKMLANTIHMMQGTPFIYQGEEIGMTNPEFEKLDDYRDVETFNAYHEMKNKGMNETEIMDVIKSKSRDNARTPMQWNSCLNAGFSDGTPWIKVADNYKDINVEESINDNDSIFYYYQKLIKLRKQFDIITYGDYKLILKDDKSIFSYIRTYKNEKLLVINNFYGKSADFKLPQDIKFNNYKFKILISNYDDPPNNYMSIKLRPYECITYYFYK